MKIYIPHSAFLGNFNQFLMGFDPNSPDKLEITSNPKWIAVHPVALAMIGALAKTVEFGSISCNTFNTKARNYIIRMGALNFCGLDPGPHRVVEHEPAGRFIPLMEIRDSGQAAKFIGDIVPLLHLQDLPDQAQTISYIVSELVRNVLEHANAEHGAIVCAQYYKKSNSIGIGIADTGLGIKKTINRSHPAFTDLEAIRLALQPGITGTTSREGGTAENAGNGLFFTKSIAHVNKDFFVLYSGNALYKLLKPSGTSDRTSLYGDPFDDRHSKGEIYPYWQGTVVGINISLDRTRELSALLGLIRESCAKEMRERRRARYRKPKFTT